MILLKDYVYLSKIDHKANGTKQAEQGANRGFDVFAAQRSAKVRESQRFAHHGQRAEEG